MFETQQGKYFFLLQNAHIGFWNEPASVLTGTRFNGYPCSFPGVKQPRPEADHSAPINLEFKTEWSCMVRAFVTWTRKTSDFCTLFDIVQHGEIRTLGKWTKKHRTECDCVEGI